MADPAETEIMRQILAQEPMAPRRVPRPGDPGLPAQAPGEMRSANTPMGDALAQMLGSTAVGPAVGAVENFGRATGEAAAGMTGVPWAVQTGDQLAEALARGGSGLPDMSSPAQAEGDKLQQLLTQRASLDQQRALAVQERDAQLKGKDGRKGGRGPIYDDKNAEVQRLTNEMSGLDKSIEFEQKMHDPTFLAQVEKDKQLAAEDKAKRDANTPFRERFPALANSLPNYAMAASAGIPALMGFARNMRTFTPNSATGRMIGSIGENNTARAGGDAAAEAMSRSELADLLRNPPTKMGDFGKGSAAALSGGALAAEGSMYPDQFDAINLPEGPLKDKARALALNPLAYAERGVMGTLTGASGYKTARQLTPSREAPSSRAQAIVDNPPSNGPPPIPLNAAPAPQLPPPGGGPAGQPPLPPGMAYNARGLPYDIHTGQIVKKKYFTPRP